MTANAERLRTVRTVYRRRGGGRTGGDITYAIYMGVLLLGAVAFPWIRAVALAMAQPAVLQALAAPAAGQVVGAVAGVLLAGLTAAGAMRGPALLSPFFTVALAGNDLPRSSTLLRPFLTAAAALTAVLTGAAMLAGAVLVTTGTAGLWSCVAFVAAVACLGVIGSAAWLAGQVLGPRHSGRLPTLLLAVVALTWCVPALAATTPWGWVGLLWAVGGTTAGFWGLACLLAVAAAAAWSVPVLLDSLTGHALMEQSQRWEAAGTFAMIGDASGALGSFRAQPRWGRTWWAVSHRSVAVRFFVRDLIGSLRTPYRFLSGTGFLMLGSLVVALAPGMSGVPAWLPGSVGAGLCYLALGVFGDGFRHAAQAAATAPLYGCSNGTLYALHSLLPFVVALACGVAGIGFAAAGGLPFSVVAAAVPVCLVAIRAYDSAKGPLPPSLLTPMPTQFGDMSSIAILTWQADALLISLAVGAGALSLLDAGAPLGAAAFLAGAAVVVLAMAWRRIRNQ